MAFPHILVINLPERKDRWEDMEKDLESWDVPFERVDAVKMTPGWKGCSLSHKKCIEIAKQRKYPWVLILEDDCKLYPDTKKRFEKLLERLWTMRYHWEIFTGGPTQIRNARVMYEDPLLFQVESYSTHFILVPEHTYDKILNEINENTKVDVHYRNHFNMWCTLPHLATQKTSYSDIEKIEKDYTLSFENSHKFLWNVMNPTDYMGIAAAALVVTSLIGLLYVTTMRKK
jgi:GR25 family glycosyltransferase involved in LPS biosynthesis